MPLSGDRIADMWDTGPLDRAGRRICERSRDTLLRHARGETPVAEPPPGVDKQEWIAERGGREPGTLKAAWETEGPDRTPTGWTAAILNADEAADPTNNGSPPHVITPNSAGALRFRDEAGRVILTQHVDHPGTPAQNMTGKAADALERRLPEICDDELDRMARELERS